MVQPVNVFFVNGMITSKQEADKITQDIASLTEMEVELFYNKSTSLIQVLSILGKVLYGVISLGCYAATIVKKKTEDAKQKDRYSMIVGSVATLALGFKEWHDIQVDKVKHGKALANRIEVCLKEQPNKKVRLILHSQGAHVGFYSLKHLQDYRDRIEVVNLGGMVEIPQYMASCVTNFSNKKDPVPNYVSYLTSERCRWVNLGDQHTKTWLGHGVDEYLQHQDVQDCLKGKVVVAVPAA